jgi:hypothetical protein
MNIYNIITCDFQDVCFQQESETPVWAVGFSEPAKENKINIPDKATFKGGEKPSPNSILGCNPEVIYENNPFPGTHYVRHLH